MESRPCSSANTASLRSQIHLTGRPSRRAAKSTRRCSGYCQPLMPKAPPISAATTLILCVGTLKTRSASMSRTRWGYWTSAYSVKRSSRGSWTARAPLDHMRGARESGIGRGFVADGEDMRDVVGAFVPDRRAPRAHRLVRRGHRRERVILDLDLLCRILGLRQALGNHHRDGIADI